jgi:hypothetical protein
MEVRGAERLLFVAGPLGLDRGGTPVRETLLVGWTGQCAATVEAAGFGPGARCSAG